MNVKCDCGGIKIARNKDRTIGIKFFMIWTRSMEIIGILD